MEPVIGIQLYTLRDHIQTAADFDATLGRLAAMGVRDVQISGIGDIPAEEQRDVLQKHGMRVCVTHKSFDRMRSDLPALIAEHKTIGCDALGLGSCPGEYRDSLAGVRAFLDAVRPIGEALAEAGMTFNYHNHDFEFRDPADSDVKIMDVLLAETDPALFRFIPDVAWIHYAGRDPVEVLRKMKGRVKVLHFKDYIIDEAGERKFVSLGRGRVDLAACFRAARELEIPYVMYEQDCDWVDGDPFKATAESWAYMRALASEA